MKLDSELKKSEKLSIEEKDKFKEERQRIGEERAGVEAGFIDRCDNLLMYFEPNGEPIFEEVFCGPVEAQRGFVFDRYVSGFGKGPYCEEEYKNLKCIAPEMWEEISQEAEWTPYKIAFAIGFCMGQSIGEVTDSDVQADIEAIKKVIREKQLIPFFPRERKAA